MEQESNKQKAMGDIDGGLHPAVAGTKPRSKVKGKRLANLSQDRNALCQMR